MGRDLSLGKTFRKVSEEYDSARTGYPEEVIDYILTQSGIGKDGRILDVGCGTGKATTVFAERGYEVVGVDIGEELIAIARRNTAGNPKVTYQVSKFENANLDPESFDLVVSAQAWHWVDSEVGYQKVHDLLKREGHFSILWKSQQYDQLEFLKELRKLYKKCCPKYCDPEAPRVSEAEFPTNKLFCEFRKHEVEYTLDYSHERYVQYVSTMSWVSSLESDAKKNFFFELSDLLAKQEETLTIPYKCKVMIAKKK
ncbi:MAG: class I SAM-dependent methyltransferase [Nanoarchaeota archaeon]